MNELAEHHCVTPDVNELPYNLLSRTIEFESISSCKRHHCGIIGYMTLMQGVLGKALGDFDELPPQLRRTRHFDSRKNPLARHDGNGAEEILKATLEKLHALADELKCSLPELAIRWVTSNPSISCALVGVRSPERLMVNVQAAVMSLPDNVIRQLNQITEALKQELGPSIDYYESVINNRT
jgi:L-glyceraldehyde 3-phosphate reductase